MKHLCGVFGFAIVTYSHAFAAHLTPWKVTVLNGFPEVAGQISEQTKESLRLLEKAGSSSRPIPKSSKVKSKHASAPDQHVGALKNKMTEVESLIKDAKSQLIENNLSPDLFEEVDLDLKDVRTLIQQRNFKAAAEILRVYDEALGTFVFVK